MNQQDPEQPKRKRGRPAAAAADASTVTAADRPRKRVRRSEAETDNADKGVDGHTERRRSTRDRTSGDSNSSWWQASIDEEPEGPSRSRPSGNSPPTSAAAKKQKSASVSKSAAKKRLSGPQRPSVGAPDNTTPAPKRRKPGRPPSSGSPAGSGLDSSRTPGSAKTRRLASVASGAPSSRQAKSRAKPSRPKPRRISGAPAEGTGTEHDKENGRGQDETDEEVGEAGEKAANGAQSDTDGEEQLPYGRLVPCTRLVPLATMTKKWAPLEPEALATVQSLLADCARPVLAQVRADGVGGGGGGATAERRQEQSRQAITAVMRRVRSKLVRGIPFPPGVGAGGRGSRRKPGAGRADTSVDFNFERTVDGLQALEHQLGPLQHAIALLQRERRREERALEADYALLRQLQTNAQAEQRAWHEHARRASHVLAPAWMPATTSRTTENGPGTATVAGIVVGGPLELARPKQQPQDEDGGDGGLFQTSDAELLSLATDLTSHMDSLHGNLQQIDGIVPAMTRSRAALQQVLHRYVEPNRYEHIMLGG